MESILPSIDIETAQGPATVTAAISMVPIDKIEANPYQPRKDFDETALEELTQSIRQQGIITPVTVRKMSDSNYQLIAGERRFRAAQRAGLTELPAYIRVATDTQMMEMALVENIQRENLNAIEIALSYNALIEECQLTHEQLSDKVGKDRSTITNYLRLLNLPAETQMALSSEKISMAHARALVPVEDTARHLELLRTVIERHLTVHQTELLVKAERNPPVKAKTKGMLPSIHAAAQSQLRQDLQSEVEIKRSRRGKGSLTIHFNSDSDFERILTLLRNK